MDMHLLFEAFVPGFARTKGSLTYKGRGRMVDSDLSIMWRRLVAYKCRAAYLSGFDGRREPSALPIYIEGVYTLPGLDMAAIIAQGAGDIDKLDRNILDALATDPDKPDLSAGVYLNDAQVIALNVAKQPDRNGVIPRGVNLKVWEIPL